MDPSKNKQKQKRYTSTSDEGGIVLPFFSQQSDQKAVPHLIPKLELLVNIVEIAKKNQLVDLNKILFVGVQHILETTASLFNALIDLGADPNNIFLSGKSYSTCPAVAQSMQNLGITLIPDLTPKKPGEYETTCRKQIRGLWELVTKHLESTNSNIEKIIIIDDGGRCFEEMPNKLKFKYSIAGIEQTRGGLYSKTLGALPFPIVEVASSATKRYFESLRIADAIFRVFNKQLSETLQQEKDVVWGIVGNGAIGEAIACHLLSSGETVVVFDESETAFQGLKNGNNKLFRVNTIEAVIVNATIIFGCTGRDISSNINFFELAKGPKRIFVSCTSEDKEFLRLLNNICRTNDYSIDRKINVLQHQTSSGCLFQIFNMGYPANFDHNPWNVSAKDIELTQALILGGIIQAVLSASKPIGDGITVNLSTRDSLNPYLQKYICQAWLSRSENATRYPNTLIEQTKFISWIDEHSGGNKPNNENFKLLENVFEKYNQKEIQHPHQP